MNHLHDLRRVDGAVRFPPPAPSSRGITPRLSLLLGCAAVVMLVAGCSDPGQSAATDQPEQAAAELPELPLIGGARDVWAFEFGMDADREAVRDVLGEPKAILQSEQTGEGSSPTIERWAYDGLEITFLIDTTGESEYLLSVRIDEADVPLRGGLAVDMGADEARELLGEPRVNQDDTLVYFYRNTTIELITSRGIVEAVLLARALP